MASITVIVPAYNEEKNIRNTIGGIRKSTAGLRQKLGIVVVDDGSTDHTSKILSSVKGIKVIRHGTNKGYGASLKTGIKNSSADYIMIIDADGTYPAAAIPDIVKNAQKYDMVVGARTGEAVKIPFFRKPAKWFLKHFAQYLTKSKIPDLNSGLRIFRREIAIRFMSLFPDGFSFTTTLTIACLTNDLSVKFIPINYLERKGKSKIHPIKDMIGFTNLIFRLAIFFRPLNVFMPISLFFFIAGALKLIRDFVMLNNFGLGGAIAILAAIQIALMGMLAELVIKRTSL